MDSFTQKVTGERTYLYVFQSTAVIHLQILPRTILFKDSSVSGNREYNGNHFEALRLVLVSAKQILKGIPML